jgi:hypothetical protein
MLELRTASVGAPELSARRMQMATKIKAVKTPSPLEYLILDLPQLSEDIEPDFESIGCVAPHIRTITRWRHLG